MRAAAGVATDPSPPLSPLPRVASGAPGLGAVLGFMAPPAWSERDVPTACKGEA